MNFDIFANNSQHNFAVESQLVLSVFHGADLLGRAFESVGFCVVRAAEFELGFDIRNFSPVRHRFDGIIGGSPCQDFSQARRTAATGYGLEMMKEFERIITEAAPKWFLFENVPRCPNLKIQGYKIQRFPLCASECGSKQRRLRHFQFGTKNGLQISPKRSKAESQLERTCVASERSRANYRSLAEFCELQGLPRDFRLKMLSIRKNYQVIGNGVPLPMGLTVANAIKELLQITSRTNHIFSDRAITNFSRAETQNNSARKLTVFEPVKSHENFTRIVTLCRCGCGRELSGKQKSATAACRKRLQVRREKGLTI